MGAANNKAKAQQRAANYVMQQAANQQPAQDGTTRVSDPFVTIQARTSAGGGSRQSIRDNQVDRAAQNIQPAKGAITGQVGQDSSLKPMILGNAILQNKVPKPESIENQIILNKRMEKTQQRLRAQTPDNTLKAVYEDVLTNPVLNDYLREELYFKDEADEDGREGGLDYRHANDKVSPQRWDSNTVVLEVFRVLQDLTQYKMDLTVRGGELSKFVDFKGGLSSAEQQRRGGIPASELLAGNPLIEKMNIQFVGSLAAQGGKEGYTHDLLYDQQINANLSEPAVIQRVGKSKMVMTMRVEFQKLLRTTMLKFPVDPCVDKELFMQQMQAWSSMPYHEKILKPICFASLNEQTPLVFIEDMPFVHTLEDVVLERSFYKGYQFRFEISHKILSCALQVAECLDHAHQSGVMHYNLHPGNILVPRCADRDEQIGFYMTDFGDPLMLLEDTIWNDKHEKVFSRLMRFYPPNILSLYKSFASSQVVEQKREILRRIKSLMNILVDIYSFGMLLLFLMVGGYEWSCTIEIQSLFEAKMQKAETIVDIQTLQVLKAIVKRCLLISKSDQPFDKISDIILNLRTAKEQVESIMRKSQIKYYTYDKVHKPLYEFLPGRRKEDLVSKKLEFSAAEDFSISEREIFQSRHKRLGRQALNPESKPESQENQHLIPNSDIKKYNDEDVDLIILNNQAVLAYIKQNYDQCLQLFFKIYDILETHPISYFNYLLLCWESGIFSDDFVLNELGRVTTHPELGQNFSALLFALVYEGQNNWLAAKTNYELAMFSASDSVITEVRNRLQNAKYFYDKYPDQFLFGHLEMSDVCDIVVSFNGKMAVSFQKTSRIIVWNLQTQKILKEIEDKNAMCMDANAKLDRVVVGLRNGLIVMFNFTYDGEFVVNVDEVELGFHVSTVLVVKLSKDGYFGISGGLDPYVALWNCQKKLLLSKIDIPGQYLKTACLNMNGEEFMFSTSTVFSIQVYHHFSNRKQIEQTFSLDRHKAQVTDLEISFDGMLGVSGGQDRMIYLWDLTNGDCLRDIAVTSFVVRLCLTPMAKFLAINLLDGSLLLYEVLTGIIWKTERFPGKHSGIAIITSNFMFEVAKEGLEHKLIEILERDKAKLLEEFEEARGLNESTEEVSKHKSGTQMPTVPEVDEEESEFRKTRQTQQDERQESRKSQRRQDEGVTQVEDERMHEVNRDEEIMLQDLFFENAIFKYYYFQNEEFTKNMSPYDVQQELASLTFERAKDPYQENHYLQKTSLDHLRLFRDLSPQERAHQNFLILEDRRAKFDQLIYRNFKEIKQIREQYDKCRLIMVAAETRGGEDSDITRQGSVVGLRVLHVNLPFIGIGPCQFITNADVTRNVQVKMRIKAKQMREKGIQSYMENSKEQAKYYFQRMREVQPLYMNPSAIQYWADLQMESYKKGKIHNIFKVKTLVTRNIHIASIEHMRFTRNEKFLIVMSKDFKTSIWSVGEWVMMTTFRAYHDAHAQYYLRQVNEELIQEEFDVAVVALSNNTNLMVCGLYNGALQFWEISPTQKKFELALEIPSHLAEVTAVEFNSDQSIIVSAGADYLINVWNAMSKSLLFEIREHLGAISYLGFVEEQDEEGHMEEQIVSIDIEGYMIYVSLDGYIEKKFSVERTANHAIESMDVVFSGYENERELFLVRRNLNTSFYEFQKIKAGVEPYYAAYDYNTFPTIVKNKVDKRKGIDFLYVNQRGEFVCMAMKRDNQISFRSNSTLMQEKRLELKEQINIVLCGQLTPYMILNTEQVLKLILLVRDLVYG